jgi:hypothetical protein
MTCLWFPSVGAAQEDLNQIRAAVEHEISLESGDIEIRGVLMNASGDSLYGVTIQVEDREYGDVVSRTPPSRETLVADGEFVVSRFGISSVSLVILKDGYYPISWSYNFSPDTPRRIPDGVESFEIEVVLTPKPDPAPLRKIEGFARTAEDGSVERVITAPSEPAPVPLSGEKLRAWKAKKRGGPALQLEGQLDEQGRFVIGHYTPREQNHAVDGLLHGWLRVSSGAVGDGFVRFTPEEIPHRSALGLRSMNEAPADGYADSLELGVALGEEVVYFYCRIGGQYGKGMVSGRPYVVDGDRGPVAAAKVTVFMNPTGSRDVAYVHN